MKLGGRVDDSRKARTDVDTSNNTSDCVTSVLNIQLSHYKLVWVRAYINISQREIDRLCLVRVPVAAQRRRLVDN